MNNLHQRQVYSGLMEILKDNKYFYYSPVSYNYCKLTDDGKTAILEYLEQIAPYMMKKEQEEFEARAKTTVWNELNR